MRLFRKTKVPGSAEPNTRKKECGTSPHRIFFFFIVGLLVFVFQVSGEAAQGTLWERMCAACHDGQTVLNGKVVASREDIKAKYHSLDELVTAVSCKSPPCMNILKHDEKLVRKVGKEIGIKK